MNAKIQNGFQIGALSGLTWNEIEGHAGQVGRQNGDVWYCGKYLCTAFNDEDGGDIVNADGRPMTDNDIQVAIEAIDVAREQAR